METERSVLIRRNNGHSCAQRSDPQAKRQNRMYVLSSDTTDNG